jgi:hypothetical protein
MDGSCLSELFCPLSTGNTDESPVQFLTGLQIPGTITDIGKNGFINRSVIECSLGCDLHDLCTWSGIIRAGKRKIEPVQPGKPQFQTGTVFPASGGDACTDSSQLMTPGKGTKCSGWRCEAAFSRSKKRCFICRVSSLLGDRPSSW